MKSETPQTRIPSPGSGFPRSTRVPGTWGRMSNRTPSMSPRTTQGRGSSGSPQVRRQSIPFFLNEERICPGSSFEMKWASRVPRTYPKADRAIPPMIAQDSAPRMSETGRAHRRSPPPLPFVGKISVRHEEVRTLFGHNFRQVVSYPPKDGNRERDAGPSPPDSPRPKFAPFPFRSRIGYLPCVQRPCGLRPLFTPHLLLISYPKAGPPPFLPCASPVSWKYRSLLAGLTLKERTRGVRSPRIFHESPRQG